MAQPPQSLTPAQQAIIGAFEELDSAIKSVVRNFGRMAQVVDAAMSDAAGLKPRHLEAVPTPDPDAIPASHTDEDIIAAAEKALHANELAVPAEPVPPAAEAS